MIDRRAEVLDKAKEIVTKDRQNQYGEAENNFQRIADMWSAYLQTKITANDVSMMMTLLKIARIKGGNFKADSFIDACGYVACGYQISMKEQEEVPFES